MASTTTENTIKDNVDLSPEEQEAADEFIQETAAEALTALNPSIEGPHRRIGRVKRWLSKGYGFVIDLGRLDTVNTANSGYGWIADQHTGKDVYVYHNDLVCEKDRGTYHRLFANEYIEYTADYSLPQKSGRAQALSVTGIAGAKLLCDENAAANAAKTNQDGEQQPTNNRRNNNNRRGNNNNRNGGGGGQATTVQYIYYVPQGGVVPTPDGNAPTPAGDAPEPKYVTPTNGIPVPK